MRHTHPSTGVCAVSEILVCPDQGAFDCAPAHPTHEAGVLHLVPEFRVSGRTNDTDHLQISHTTRRWEAYKVRRAAGFGRSQSTRVLVPAIQRRVVIPTLSAIQQHGGIRIDNASDGHHALANSSYLKQPSRLYTMRLCPASPLISQKQGTCRQALITGARSGKDTCVQPCLPCSLVDDMRQQTSPD